MVGAVKLQYTRGGWVVVTVSTGGRVDFQLQFEDFRWPLVRDNVVRHVMEFRRRQMIEWRRL